MKSLHRYLDPSGNKMFLNLSWAHQDRDLPKPDSFPRDGVGESDGLARIVEARLLSDAGSEIKKMFLLVQRDVYPIKSSEVWPFNNTDVKKAWERSFSFHADPKHNHGALIVLSDQVDEQGKLTPFASLFYCKTQDVFFHPPCPRCGQKLQQCENDGLLSAAGLDPFSISLRRYLYCPACGASEFYAYERKSYDPPTLKDRQTLMQNFAGLKRVDEATSFPCLTCSFHEECHGASGLARERIKIFSFYPFYLLAFEAASIHAIDFIPLLSGASLSEGQASAEKSGVSSRKACLDALREDCTGNLFLFDHDERHFLEILYLKLTFLEQVVGSFHRGGRFERPDMRPGLEQIWVKLPETRGGLPWFWNFKVRILGVGVESRAPGKLEVMPDDAVTLGLIWFYTLLSNKEQRMPDILNGLREFSSMDAESFEKMDKKGIFDAANIFWTPQGRRIPDVWMCFWEDALNIGWDLLRPERQRVEKAGETFFGRLAELKKRIKENLFFSGLPAKQGTTKKQKPISDQTKDDLIRDILLRLIDKYQSGSIPAYGFKAADDGGISASDRDVPAVAPPIGDEIEEPVIETVVFSARSSAKADALPSFEKTQVIVQKTPTQEIPIEFQETLILSVKDPKPQEEVKRREEDQLDKTLILGKPFSAEETSVSRLEKTKDMAGKLHPRDVSADLEETVVLPAGQRIFPNKSHDEKIVSDMEETVILSTVSPGPRADETHRKRDGQKASFERDALAETVILRPGEKSKDGAKK